MAYEKYVTRSARTPYKPCRSGTSKSAQETAPAELMGALPARGVPLLLPDHETALAVLSRTPREQHVREPTFGLNFRKLNNSLSAERFYLTPLSSPGSRVTVSIQQGLPLGCVEGETKDQRPSAPPETSSEKVGPGS